MRQMEKYRFRDGVTPLSEAELNFRFFDIDGRLHVLEGVKVSWNAAVTEVRNHGLERINGVIQPVLDEATTIAQNASDDVDAILQTATDNIDAVQAQWEEIESDWNGIDQTISGIQSDVSGLQTGMARLPDDLTGQAGKHLKVTGDETGYELIDMPMPTQIIRISVAGAMSETANLINILAGVAGEITEVGFRLGAGQADIALLNEGQTAAAVTADAAGQTAAVADGGSVTTLSQLTIGVSNPSGSPLDLMGFIKIAPTT